MSTETPVRDDTATEDDGPADRSRWSRLDRRAVLLCVLVATVAAVASAVAVAMIASDGGRPTMGLSQARFVPSDITFTRFDGSTGTLADYEGQKLVVNFWASTCVPCRQEMPALEEVQRQAGDEITVFGLAVRDPREAALEMIETTGVTYDTALDPNGDIMTGSGGTVLPFTLFVAPDGTIMERHYGALTADELRDLISATLLAGG